MIYSKSEFFFIDAKLLVKVCVNTNLGSSMYVRLKNPKNFHPISNVCELRGSTNHPDIRLFGFVAQISLFEMSVRIRVICM